MDEQKSQIDFIVRLFQTGIKKIESLAIKLDDSIKYFETQKQKNVEFLDSYNSLSKKRNEFEDYVSNKLTDVQNNLIGNASLVVEFLNNLEDEKKSVQFLANQANFEREKLSQLSLSVEKLPRFSDLDSMKNSIQELNTLVEQNQKICQDMFLKLSNEITGFKTATASLEQNLQLLRASVDRKEADSIKHKSDVEVSLKQFDDKITLFANSVTSNINDAINAIPKPVIPRLEDAQKAFNAQLEPVVLDAKNASLRAVNNETKISILERKIDQLQLLLNKLQMQG